MKSVLLLMNNTQVGKRIEGGRVSRNLSSLPSHWLRVVLIAQAEARHSRTSCVPTIVDSSLVTATHHQGGVLAMLLGRPASMARVVRLQHAPVAQVEGWSHPAFSTVFSESLWHGHCVLVQLPQGEHVGDDYRLPDEVRLDLHARELAHMRDCRPARSVSFAGGRLALRRALWAMEAPGFEPILPGKNGAPMIPAQFTGSISHTHGLAAALVSRCPPDDEQRTAVGIDVERTSRPTSLRLARRLSPSVSQPTSHCRTPSRGRNAHACPRSQRRALAPSAPHFGPAPHAGTEDTGSGGATAVGSVRLRAFYAAGPDAALLAQGGAVQGAPHLHGTCTACARRACGVRAACARRHVYVHTVCTVCHVHTVCMVWHVQNVCTVWYVHSVCICSLALTRRSTR